MKFVADNLYHIYNQGNNQRHIFSSAEDYISFLRQIRVCILPNASLIAYCLMPNHFHLLVYVDESINKTIKQGGLLLDPLTNGIRKLLSGYARIYNKRYSYSGSLFRQKTKTKLISENSFQDALRSPIQDYSMNCFHYIHQNPLKAKLVTRLEDWEYSSFKDYAGLRNGTLCDKGLAIKYCDFSKETFIIESYKDYINELD